MSSKTFSVLLALILGCAAPVAAQDATDRAEIESDTQIDKLDQLFALLLEADESSWEAVEDEIWEYWSRSGSAAMDLLLKRGRDAMEADDLEAAVEHLTALTDHAPDFAEGWNARATAFYREGEYGLALHDIAKTLSLEPRHFSALTGLGIIFEETDEPDRALKAYQRALAIHPHQPDIKEAVQRLEAATGQDI